MENKTGTPTLVSVIRIALSMLFCICHAATRQTYIVHVKKLEDVSSFEDHARLYTSSLTSVSTSNQMMYMYRHVIAGFSAYLTHQEAEALRARDEILYVRPQMTYQLHTTRVPYFLGLEQHLDKLPKFKDASKVIIGVVDTGIWPESRSFHDAGYPPVSETRWNGSCEVIKCNKKLVGARYFSKAYEKELHDELNATMKDTGEERSPVDIHGRGTHTASTAGGSAVPGANFFGYANGTAKGTATNARVAAYKCCWKLDCADADILAAMDQAIDDNVDVLSLSLGGKEPIDYFDDPVAIGAFAAMKKGILVSCSAGNAGPKPNSVINVAPWILTVGAGTLDRDFPAHVMLGNTESYHGVSLYSGRPLPACKKMHPLIYGGDAAATNRTAGALCINNTLIPEKVRGKIVVCDRGVNGRVEKGYVVKAAGGVGMILANMAENGDELIADAHLLPALAVTYNTRTKIMKYYNLSSAANNPMANIRFEGTKLGVQPSPVVAAFSSRGPNQITPEILKPDLIAPGLSILAAWTKKAGPTDLSIDKRVVDFNIISGTSMACPQVSGLAALLKAAHPDWSPAAIRSALMTTAYSTYKNNKGSTILDAATGMPSNPLAYGAGHVDPILALDPGLVYDLSPLDYLEYFLCALNYTSEQIKTIAGTKDFTCNKKKKYSVNDLNYPSFAVPVPVDPKGNGSIKLIYKRTLTNVGQPGSTTYKVSFSQPSKSVVISVFPTRLTFSQPNENKSYTVTFTVATKMQANISQFSKIEWFDGLHVVRSPVAISWTNGK